MSKHLWVTSDYELKVITEDLDIASLCLEAYQSHWFEPHIHE
jgi:hypothetical protein